MHLTFNFSSFLTIFEPQNRNIAQPGRALASGARGREFESRYSDKKKNHPKGWFSFYTRNSERFRTSDVVVSSTTAERNEVKRDAGGLDRAKHGKPEGQNRNKVTVLALNRR